MSDECADDSFADQLVRNIARSYRSKARVDRLMGAAGFALVSPEEKPGLLSRAEEHERRAAALERLLPDGD